MRELLVEWLTAAGYIVRSHAPVDVPAAGERPDLVIVDVYMPRHQGARRLGAVKAVHNDTPVIAMSAHFRPGLAGSRAAADALGVAHVIAKPFTRGDLLAAVQTVIGSSG
jgi:CheY-like chemotaxis protein